VGWPDVIEKMTSDDVNHTNICNPIPSRYDLVVFNLMESLREEESRSLNVARPSLNGYRPFEAQLVSNRDFVPPLTVTSQVDRTALPPSVDAFWKQLDIRTHLILTKHFTPSCLVVCAVFREFAPGDQVIYLDKFIGSEPPDIDVEKYDPIWTTVRVANSSSILQRETAKMSASALHPPLECHFKS
jgi:hypothetical protein